jgi:signal transduction histidine kinase
MMTTSTRLIVLLTFALGVIMTAASVFMLRQEEDTLRESVRNELEAHAQTLQIALEQSYAAERRDEAQQLISRLGNNVGLIGQLFDEQGRPLNSSGGNVADEIEHPPELQEVLQTGNRSVLMRVIEGQEMLSIITPINAKGQLRGAFELAQPLSFVRADIARARRNFALTTLALFAGVSGIVFFVLRRGWAQPINELLNGAKVLGKGDLTHRVPVYGSSEFGQLAGEFNRMADHLAAQRNRAERDAEERLLLERELEHKERLAAVGRLAAGVAHEMGAPLNVIDARAEQLLQRPDAPLEKHVRNLEIIRSQTARITHIVRQLLNLARPYSLRKERLEIAPALRQTVEALALQAGQSGVEIVWNAPAPAFVRGDPNFLQEVFTNICANAIQAMPNGGQLLLKVEPEAASREGQVFASIRFSDTGPGVPQEHLDHIFEPFYTTKDVGSGTGLGLPVARRIIEEHGGWLEARNMPAGGAAFTVYLPVHKA